MRFTFRLGLALGIAVVALGCGGTVDQRNELPHPGDGSIPIGRARRPMGQGLTVTLIIPGGGSLTVTPESNGVVRVPDALPTGSYSLEVESDSQTHTVRFDTSIQSWGIDLFDVMLLPSNRESDVDSAAFVEGGPLYIRVGESVKLKVTVTGNNVNGLQPSYWTSGSCVSVNSGGVIRGVAPGATTITADVLGKSDTIDVIVEP